MEKLIDTSALEGGKFHGIESWTPIEVSSWQWGWNDAIDAIISNVSTVDAPEVVRCKDCRFFHRYGFKLEYAECVNFDFYDTTEDGYCCWAERREDGTID